MVLRVSLLVFSVVLFLSGSCQFQPVLFGGLQFTSARYTVNGIVQPTSYKPGLTAGVSAKIVFDKNFYFAPIIAYSLIGYKVNLNNPAYPPTEFAVNNNTSIHTVQLAPLFQIDLSSQPDHFFARFGLSINYAITGTERFDTVSTGGARGTVKRAMLFAFTQYGRATASLEAQAGYETARGLLVFAHYSYGIGSMDQEDAGPRIFNRIIGISAGYRLRALKPRPKRRFNVNTY